MNTRAYVLLCCVIFVVALCSCSSDNDVTTVRSYSMDTLDGVLSTDLIEQDKVISSDGKGSIKITAQGPVVVRLYETDDIDVEKAQLLFSAMVRSENLKGQAYLEMWCVFPGKGEFFSRALQNPLTGNEAWKEQQTPFFLNAGENPSNVKLNLVINGMGTVWIDNARLERKPLP